MAPQSRPRPRLKRRRSSGRSMRRQVPSQIRPDPPQIRPATAAMAAAAMAAAMVAAAMVATALILPGCRAHRRPVGFHRQRRSRRGPCGVASRPDYSRSRQQPRPTAARAPRSSLSARSRLALHSRVA
eukprot:scaffold107306_cov66-Phaeocystis_antarctica.AAC.7